ncbi:MAG TPA: DUF4492 domain-containing protein [Candidatus Coprenecus stercorigallinarum]|nr:DUF4492 domain-containing protein [Candidatus Coprenecus stercorigallinarum]
MERLRRIWLFYYEGFRDMSSLGRTLWIVILLKLFIMFAILRVFFFRPALADCESDAEKSRTVIENLTK